MCSASPTTSSASVTRGSRAQDSAADELRSRLAASATVDNDLVQLLRDQTERIRLLDRRLGAPGVLEQLRGHISVIERLLDHSVLARDRAPLAAALADAATLAGWQALDVGGTAQAWQHYAKARAAAQEAGSPALLAHAMGEQSYALLDLGKPEEATALVQDARSVRRLPGTLVAWLYYRRSRGPRGCRRPATKPCGVENRGKGVSSHGGPGVAVSGSRRSASSSLARQCTAGSGRPRGRIAASDCPPVDGRLVQSSGASLHTDLAAAFADVGDQDESKTAYSNCPETYRNGWFDPPTTTATTRPYRRMSRSSVCP